MSKNCSKLSGQSLVTTDCALAPLLRIQKVTALAANEHNQTILYGMARLAAEIQRQIRLIAEKGGVTPEERSHLNSLLLACMAELHAVNIDHNAQLIEILSHQRKEQSNG